MNNQPTIAFFGGEPLAVPTLNNLREIGILPELIICNVDRPVGRKRVMKSPPAKIWALENNIEVFQPESIGALESIEKLSEKKWDLFIVVAYNQIISQNVLDIPQLGTLNVHPSLLPKLRGASPIRSAILNDMRTTGVTIMLMDEKMDHGPIIGQKPITVEKENWPMRGRELDAILAQQGAKLLAQIIPDWINDVVKPQPQNHAEATFCTKITKEMGEIQLNDDPYKNYLKFCAYDGWPGIFYFDRNGKRIKITQARFENGEFIIEKIIPEGKKEMIYTKNTT